MSPVKITPIKVVVEFTVEEIALAMYDPKLNFVARRLEAARRMIEQEHEDRWRTLKGR